MRPVFQALNFVDVLPSALLVLGLGILLSIFSAPIAWLGSYGWMSLFYGAVLGCAFYALVFLFTCTRWFVNESMFNLHASLHNLFRNFTWPQIIVVSLLAGVGEELLIRGVIQTSIVNISSPMVGIVVASLIFGLLHFLSKAYVFVTFILGLCFGVIYYVTQSMVLIMIAHAVYDVLAFAMIVKHHHMLGIDLGYVRFKTKP